MRDSKPYTVTIQVVCRVAYLEALRRALPRVGEGGALASVLEHCMYCGMSLGRVGLDFRGLLPPLFEAAALRLFRSSVQVWPRCRVVCSSAALGVLALVQRRLQVSLGGCGHALGLLG